jgi:hypothetical protein
MTLEEAATVHQDHRGDFAVSGALDDRRRAEEKLGRPYDAVATDVSGGVDSVLYDERYVRRKTLPRRQRSVSACGPHGIEIHRIAGAGLQNGNIVVAPATVAREQPAMRKDRGVEHQGAGQAGRRVG